MSGQLNKEVALDLTVGGCTGSMLWETAGGFVRGPRRDAQEIGMSEEKCGLPQN